MYSEVLLSTILVLLAIYLAKSAAFGTETTRTVETQMLRKQKILNLRTVLSTRIAPASAATMVDDMSSFTIYAFRPAPVNKLILRRYVR